MVPVDCLGTVVLTVASCAGIAGIVMGGMKFSWAYSEGVDLARHDKRVVEALGEPIDTGWLVSGSIKSSGPTGDADLAIPLSGRQDSGTLDVVAHKRAGEWKFERAEVEVHGWQQRINLLAKEKPQN